MFDSILNHAKYRIPFPDARLPEVNGPILVLSPHFDDDILGCGGALLKYSKQGKDVYILYFTNGIKGRPESIPKESISGIRHTEAGNAAEVLGISRENLICLNIQDGCVNSNGNTHEFEEIILKINPSLVFVPFIFDFHPDHRGTAAAFADFCKNNRHLNPDICDIVMYEVWTPLLQNLCINITEEMPLKIKALKMHKSQLEMMNYVEMVTSLNTYRASFFNNRMYKYAEAFFHCYPDEFSHFMNKAET